MPNITVLVGIPASGKSSYREALIRDAGTMVAVVSSDDYLEKMAEDDGITYGEAFAEYAKDAQDHAQMVFEDAIKEGSDIIWDQTNLSSSKRKSIIARLNRYGFKYTATAAVFRTPLEECLKRNAERPAGRRIPEGVMRMMHKNFQEISADEGFDYVIDI